MEYSEIICRKVMALHQAHSQGIPHGQCCRGRAGRCQSQAVRFLFYAAVQYHIRVFGQCGGCLSHHGDKLCAYTADGWKDINNFRCFPAVRVSNHHIFRCNHTQIPVNCFGRMHKECRCSRAGHSSRHFSGNMPRLAHSG